MLSRLVRSLRQFLPLAEGPPKVVSSAAQQPKPERVEDTSGTPVNWQYDKESMPNEDPFKTISTAREDRRKLLEKEMEMESAAKQTAQCDLGDPIDEVMTEYERKWIKKGAKTEDTSNHGGN